MKTYRVTEEDEKEFLELYKAHFTAREVSQIYGCSYVTIQNYFRSFANFGIQKYDRLELISKSNPKLSWKIKIKNMDERTSDENYSVS